MGCFSCYGISYRDSHWRSTKVQSLNVIKMRAKSSDGIKLGLLGALIISMVCFVLGLAYPILIAKTTLLGFNISAESIHLTETIRHFYQSGDWFMVAIIGITTLIFPIFKYLDMVNRILCIIPVNEFYEKVMAQLDKWSMIEVFVIALVILSVKTNSSFMSMTVESGVYFLAASVIIRMLISSYMGFNKTLEYR